MGMNCGAIKEGFTNRELIKFVKYGINASIENDEV
jgi:hypothetical protein